MFNRDDVMMKPRLIEKVAQMVVCLGLMLTSAGGWGDPQHRGYTSYLGVFHRHHNSWFDPEAEGTYTWVKKVLERGEINWDVISSQARRIADACAAVDTGITDPTRQFGKYAQSWHFNTNINCWGGACDDSRILHAIRCFKLACPDASAQMTHDKKLDKEYKKMANGRAPGDESFIGTGLHPVGDVFAHIDPYVSRYQPPDTDINEGSPFYGHILRINRHKALSPLNADLRASLAVDDPKHLDHYSHLSLIPEDRAHKLSQRYSDLKTSSLLYLYVYDLFKNPMQAKASIRDEILERIQQSLSRPRGRRIDFSRRGTHGVLGLIDAMLKDDYFSPVKDCLEGFKRPLKEVYGENTVGIRGSHNPHTSLIKVTALMDELMELQIKIHGPVPHINEGEDAGIEEVSRIVKSTGDVYVANMGDNHVQLYGDAETLDLHDYKGPITITSGQLTFPAGSIANPVTLSTNGSSTSSLDYDSESIFQSISFNGGTIDPDAGPLTLDVGAALTTTTDTLLVNPVHLTGNASFTQGTTGKPSTLMVSGAMSGAGGITSSGPGLLILSGNNTYAGPTVVSSGRLHAESLNGPVTVNSGATFSGGGVINGAITNKGTVEPSMRDQTGAFGIGTLTVTGDYTQTGALGIHMRKSDGVWTSSLLDVKGTATLSQESTVIFMPAVGLDPNDVSLTGYTVTFMKAEGGIKGNLSTGMPDGMSFQLVGPKVSSDGRGQEIYAILHPAQSHTTSTSAVTLSSEVNNAALNMLSNQISRTQDKMDTAALGRTDSMDMPFRSLAYGSTQMKSCSLFSRSDQRNYRSQDWETLLSIVDQSGPLDLSGNRDTTFWLSPVYTQGRNKKTPTTGASSDHMQLLLAGMEWKNPETKHVFGVSLGGGFGGSKSSVISGNRSHHKMVQGAFYNSLHWDKLRFDAFLNVNRTFGHTKRVANVSEGIVVQSSPVTDTLGASAEVSYKVDLGDLMVVRPYYGLDYWYIMAHGYREKDNILYAQSHARMTSGGYDHYLGVSLRKTWMDFWNYALRVEGNIWYSRILHDVNLRDRVTAVDGGGMISTKSIGGYGLGTLSPSLTFSLRHQETGTKYAISFGAALQDKRTSYQGLLKASVPLN